MKNYMKQVRGACVHFSNIPAANFSQWFIILNYLNSGAHFKLALDNLVQIQTNKNTFNVEYKNSFGN